MPFSPPVQVLVGPPHHGVTEYASDLAEALVRRDDSVVVVAAESHSDVDFGALPTGRIHLHVTDGLFGDDLESAAARVEQLTAAGRVSLTFHDVPQPSDGERNLRRRGVAYARMAASAVGVVVSSRHEADLLREHVDATLSPAVIPLGTRRSSAPTELGESVDPAVVLVAGFVYPGKGHDDVVEAAAVVAARMGEAVSVEALGGVSPGHEWLVEALAARAETLRVPFRVTGYVAADAYRERVRLAGIPVVAHQHYSASRSLIDWADQGRRPLVVDTRYAREMAELRPETLELVPSGITALADAIEKSIRDPGRTRLAPGLPIAPSLDDAGLAMLRWWRTLPW